MKNQKEKVKQIITKFFLGISMRNPVVGYTGFTPAVASGNIYSKDYQKCYRLSKGFTKTYFKKKRTNSSLPTVDLKKSEKNLLKKSSATLKSKFHKIFSREKYPTKSKFFE